MPLPDFSACLGASHSSVVIQVWTLPVSIAMLEDEYLQRQLSAEEGARARRFLKPEDRARYLVSHAALRLLLSRSFGIDLALLKFEYGSCGKPRLPSVRGRSPVYFNLSHSGALVVVATSRDAEIGVDVEAIDHTLDAGVAETFCSAAELSSLTALPDSQRLHALYRIWTIKEALTKAQGSGLGSSLLPDVSIDLFSSSRPGVQYSAESSESYFVEELKVPSGYAAAVASIRRPMTIHQFTVPLRGGQLDFS